MTLPHARTDDEARLYLTLRPCLCGEADMSDLAVSTEDADDRFAIRTFSGRCHGCDRPRQFRFQLPQPIESSTEVRYGVGVEPSRLLDAGEWRAVAELFAHSAREALQADAPISGWDIPRVYYGLASAVAAMEEVLKFLPPGHDAVPESAALSRDGRLVYETAPEQFTRHQLTADRDEARQLFEEFITEYGEVEEDHEVA